MVAERARRELGGLDAPSSFQLSLFSDVPSAPRSLLKRSAGGQAHRRRPPAFLGLLALLVQTRPRPTGLHSVDRPTGLPPFRSP
jgi:hypothetical protein